jgi:hypothetical protein
MSRRPQFKLALSKWHEWLIYAATTALLLTGVAWLLLERYGQVEGEFGAEANPVMPWLLKVHGVAAYAFVIVSAMLVPVHIRLGWIASRNRPSGLLMVGTSLLLALSGLALYYSTAEGFRAYASAAHWLVGLAFPILLVVHLVRGKSSRPQAAPHPRTSKTSR